MNDNAKRSGRFLIQATLAAIGTGALTKIWESFAATNTVDPTAQVAVGVILGVIIVWAQDTLEDNTGKGVLVPEDRLVGDAVLNTGIGAKKLQQGTLPESADAALLNARAPQAPSRHDQARY